MKLEPWKEHFHLKLMQEVRHELEQRGEHFSIRLLVAVLDGHQHAEWIFDAVGKVQVEWTRVAPPMSSTTTEQRHMKFVGLVADSLLYAIHVAVEDKSFSTAVLKALP